MNERIQGGEKPAKDADDLLLRELTVLYVEDEPTVREQMVQFLSRRVNNLLVAEDGRQGLELFQRERPPIVLTDIRMPHMDGLQMAAEIKSLDEETVVIVTTAYEESDIFIRAIDIGIAQYVLKPIDPPKLIRALKQAARTVNNRLRAEDAEAMQALLLDTLEETVETLYTLICKEDS